MAFIKFLFVLALAVPLAVGMLYILEKLGLDFRENRKITGKNSRSEDRTKRNPSPDTGYKRPDYRRPDEKPQPSGRTKSSKSKRKRRKERKEKKAESGRR